MNTLFPLRSTSVTSSTYPSCRTSDEPVKSDFSSSSSWLDDYNMDDFTDGFKKHIRDFENEVGRPATKDDIKRITTEEKIDALEIAAIYNLDYDVRFCMDFCGMSPIEALAEWDLL